VIAALEYDLVLHDVSPPAHDATTPEGRSVQIKATFKKALTFRTGREYYLGFNLYPDRRHKAIFIGKRMAKTPTSSLRGLREYSSRSPSKALY
jgi:hypothetical protein